jgi:hypothetical protein
VGRLSREGGVMVRKEEKGKVSKRKVQQTEKKKKYRKPIGEKNIRESKSVNVRDRKNFKLQLTKRWA